MRISAKLGLTALVAALLLSAAVSTASARSLSTSNQNIRVTWRSLEFETPLVTVRCQVTLEGSFHSRTIAKVIGSLIGHITRVTIKSESCTNATATAETSSLPWHITYEGFRGTLPRIEEVFLLLRGALFRLSRVLGGALECRVGLPTDNITGRAVINATNEATNLVPVEGRNIASLLEARNEEFFSRCPRTGRLVGTPEEGAVTLLGNTTRIRITLI